MITFFLLRLNAIHFSLDIVLQRLCNPTGAHRFQNCLDTLQSRKRCRISSLLDPHRLHTSLVANPLRIQEQFVSSLLCIISQMKVWILGGVFSSHILVQLPCRRCPSLSIRSSYADFVVNPRIGSFFHRNMSASFGSSLSAY